MSIRIVDDRYRDESDETIELTDALLDGKTVFLAGVGNDDVTTIYSRMINRYDRKLKRRARTVDGESGFVVWLEPISESANGTQVSS